MILTSRPQIKGFTIIFTSTLHHKPDVKFKKQLESFFFEDENNFGSENGNSPGLKVCKYSEMLKKLKIDSVK